MSDGTAARLNVNNQINIQLSNNRLERIITANSLDEASKMSFLDSIIDWFRGGVKKDAINQVYGLYQQIITPDPTMTNDKRAEKFIELKGLAKEKHQSKFNIGLSYDNVKQAAWSYQLNIGPHQIYQSERLNYNYENHFNELCALKFRIQFEHDFYEDKENLSLDCFINSRIECMSDDPSVCTILEKNLDNSCYSSKNFVGISPCAGDESKFVAKFKKGELVLCNRPITVNEFRSHILKKALAESSFSNLRELCSRGFWTKDNALLTYVATSSKLELFNIIGDGIHSNEVRTIAYNKKVGDSTTLGELWKLAPPLPPDGQYFADSANWDTVSLSSTYSIYTV